MNICAVRWLEEPTPAEPNVILPGWRFASEMPDSALLFGAAFPDVACGYSV
jgi:hypothetical protein